ncbi:Clc-like protein, partial [Ostertagia ostertagi]
MADGGVSKCGRKAALSTFFTVTFIAFTLSVISLISPAWQYVYLENGRTEHQHGLWLDCKRDFSFDYGRTREYYETLYRRDLQGSPFDIFFLPPLQCVYKFDYYIDPEDLYDHNHDENRIQNDAYQHLFLGWKIAALAGCGSAVVFSASALLFAVLAFCHRTFICASTVVVTIAAILSSIGVTVFYAWANYQDNKVIKEDGDTTYEQILGWAFYCQIFTTVIHWLASMLGCCVTSVSFSKSRAKLVKIEVVEGGDERQLLSGPSSSQPFKRSFSAIYRVDSQSLRQWERDYMRNARERQQQSEGVSYSQKNFLGLRDHSDAFAEFVQTHGVYAELLEKAAQSRSKKVGRQVQRELFSSASNITDTTQTGKFCNLWFARSVNTLEWNQARRPTPGVMPPTRTTQPSALPALPKLKSALKTPQQSRKSVNIDDSDVTYECLPCDASAGVSSLFGGRPSSSLRGHQYDPVYEQIGQENYLEPNSVRMRSNQALNIDQDKK